MKPKWKPWIADDKATTPDGLIERTLPDGQKVRLPFYLDPPTRHRILRDFLGFHVAGTEKFKAGTIAYLSEGLSRLATKDGDAVPVEGPAARPRRVTRKSTTST